jgi:hypothetical protein
LSFSTTTTAVATNKKGVDLNTPMGNNPKQTRVGKGIPDR